VSESNISLTPALSSQWGGLSNHLIASFYEVDRHGDTIKDADGNPVNIIVRAPLTDGDLDISLNWQGAFEEMSGNKASTIFAMLQAGAIQPVIDAFQPDVVGKAVASVAGDQAGNAVSDGIAYAQQQSGKFLKQFEGRTGITKLNSNQVFSGMPPIKFQVTALFRAWSDPISEVEAPVNQLITWALPKQLADDSLVTERIKAVMQNRTVENAINALLPSKSPCLIVMKYKGRTYAPLVIEAVRLPLSSSIDSNGHFIERLVTITICSLAAWDRDDWAKSTNY